MPHLNDWFERAFAQHQAGNLAEAGALYQKILHEQPEHTETLYLLGTLHAQLGKHDSATRYLRIALDRQPDHVQAHFNLALLWQEQGCFEESVASYERVVALQPDYAEAHNNLGVSFLKQGHVEAAAACFEHALVLNPHYAEAHNNLGHAQRHRDPPEVTRASYTRAIALQPDFVEAHYNLGKMWHDEGQLDTAVACYQRALALKPDFAEAHYNLGLARQHQGALEAAAGSYRQAITCNPDEAKAHYNLGNLLKTQGDLRAAVACLKRAVALDPDCAEVHNNLGVALHQQEHLEAAAASFERALVLQPEYAAVHNNLGNTLKYLGRLDAARASFERALALNPDFVEARWNRSQVWLMQGNLVKGWPEYEWRQAQQPQRAFPRPRWDGSSLTNRTILVYAEQGVGDELMFASCFPDLMAQAKHVVLECDSRLVSLFTRSFPNATVYGKHRWADREVSAHVPPVDAHIAAGSLPRYLRPTLASFPPQAGYLTPDARRRTDWQQRLATLGPGLKVGIAWRSRASRQADRYYTRLAAWEPILTVPGVHFVNLQYDAPETELAAMQQQLGVPIHTWDDVDLLNDFEGVAALVAALALVIAPEMTTAALAGSVGARVWQLLTYAGSWPMLGTDRQPWFPTMRVFRQMHLDVWDEVIRGLADALRQRAQTACLPGFLDGVSPNM